VADSYSAVRETAAQKRCVACGYIAVFENIKFERQKVYQCLSSLCGYKEPIVGNAPSERELIASIERLDIKEDILTEEDIADLIKQLSTLIEEIVLIDEKKRHAESIYRQLRKAKVMDIPGLPWAPKDWYTSKKHDHCQLCGTEFKNRQSYRYDYLRRVVCRYGCQRSTNG